MCKDLTFQGGGGGDSNRVDKHIQRVRKVSNKKGSERLKEKKGSKRTEGKM